MSMEEIVIRPRTRALLAQKLNEINQLQQRQKEIEKSVKELCDVYLENSGAQGEYGVTPDLSLFRLIQPTAPKLKLVETKEVLRDAEYEMMKEEEGKEEEEKEE